MPPALIDTNVLLRSLDRPSEDRSACERLLRAAEAGQVDLVGCAQVFIEFWAVATRPLAANGFAYTPRVADAKLEEFEQVIPCLREPPDVFDLWRELAVEHAVSGKPTHDARLVAVMWAYGLRRLVTLNGRHFRRFAEIEAVAPAEVLAETGA